MNTPVLDPIIPKNIVEAIKDTFNLQASCQIEISKVEATVPVAMPGIDIVSAIGVHSSNLIGTIALCLPKKTFLGVVNKILGESYTEITSENLDSAGELLNIIYASARVKINQGGHDFAPAIPTVAKGADIQISHGQAPKIVRVECQSEFGPFHLEISLMRAKS